MLKQISIFIVMLFVFSACATNSGTIAQVEQISNSTQCQPCESNKAFEAKIKGLIYLSDVGLKCCANKRTLDTSVALKKVYLHRIYDLEEEKKIFKNKNASYYLDEHFNVILYSMLKTELKNRGIIVLEKSDSPYDLKLDLAFTDFNSKVDNNGLHSRVKANLKLRNINTQKTLAVSTRQDVVGFKDEKEMSFYTHLLLKQMANKIASIISSL